MIVLRIGGGMGNQMFQYAAAKATARRLGTELLLDMNWFTEETRRSGRDFALDCFGIREKTADFRDVFRLLPGQAVCDWVRGDASLNWRRVLARELAGFMRVIGMLPKKKEKVLHENAGNVLASFGWGRVYFQRVYRCTPDFADVPDNTYMIGYWESENFWKEIKAEILSLYSFGASLREEPAFRRIKNAPSVSIHVRRTDKLMAAPLSGGNVKYIQSAVRLIKEKVDNPSFFVFSDDMEWCKTHLPSLMGESAHCFVENSNKKPHVDLFLMSQCGHNIIGPSTFSWWGAYLNANPQKIVIAPHESLWHEDGNDRCDLLPPRWTVLKC
jgi:hypothetical protein